MELNKAVFVTYLIVPHQLSSEWQKKPLLYTGSKYLLGIRTDIARPSSGSSSTPSAILVYFITDT